PVQTLDGALYQRREILPASGQRQSLGKEGHRIRRRHGLRKRMCVFPRRVDSKGGPFRLAREIKHVATGGLDEQRFLGAEVIGDLAWKGVGGRRNVGDRGPGKPPLLE